jgi:hypothetical protein
MGWPNTEEGREKKRADQRRWWHKKHGGVERSNKTTADSRAERKKEDEIRMIQMQDPNVIQEQYSDTVTTDTPVLKSELEMLFDQVPKLRQHINELTEKRDSLKPRTMTGDDSQTMDAVELADEQELENARVLRLVHKYAAAIAEKEMEYEALQTRIELMKERKRDIEQRIKALKGGTMDAHLDLVARARQASEQELAMHTAVLSDSPTYAQRIIAKRGKRGAERQIRGQIQKEAELRMVIPELEAMLSYLSGDFEGQRKLQKQLEKQSGRLAQQLKQTPTGEEPDAPEDRPKFVEFLQPWGGFRDGMYQMVATLSEEISADLVDAQIAKYVPAKPVDDETTARELAARHDGTGNYSML